MRIPSNILVHKITYEKYEGETAYGPQYATPVTHKWRMEPKRKRVVNREGQEVISEAFAIAPVSDDPVTVGSRVTWDKRIYRVLEVREIWTLYSKSHNEVYLS